MSSDEYYRILLEFDPILEALDEARKPIQASGLEGDKELVKKIHDEGRLLHQLEELFRKRLKDS